MLNVINRKEYWRWMDDGIIKPTRHDLKTIQDAYILSELGSVRGSKILEVGGGNSRVAAQLASGNEVWLADGFEGKDGGPGEIPKIPGVKMIQSYLGSYSGQLPAAYFDYVFSISVVEHVPSAAYADFMKDAARVLKPGGSSLHAIDVYLYDDPDASNHGRGQQARLALYLKSPECSDGRLQWAEAPAVVSKLAYATTFAYNSMETLIGWNRIVPSIKDIRAEAMSCSLKMSLKKVR